MQKARTVLYIDAKGFEHEALVTALNGLHEGYLSLVYIDDKAEEADNVKKVFDIPHLSDDSRQETREVAMSDQAQNRGLTVLEGNLHLPTYHVNCWKEVGEAHKPFPADHPQFDHPFEEAKFDEHGVHQPKARPEFDADIVQHLTGPVDQADGAGNKEAEPSEIERKLRLLALTQKAALEQFAYSRENDATLIRELREENAQLEVAVDQGSTALYAKDAEIERLKAASAAVSAPAEPANPQDSEADVTQGQNSEQN
jgi:hypothetical protein